MASSLTVRNLSSAPILINCVERFEDPHTLQSKPSVFSFTSSNTTSAAPSASKLGEHAGTFNRHDPKVPLSPFESFTLGHQEAGANGDSTTLASTTLRLTIEGSKGERFRIDINPSYTQKSTQAFTPLTPNPSFSYTALFHPIRPIAHLTIHGNHLHDFRKWMDALPSNLPLSALSIPGTHNSHTCYRALPSVRCQVVPVKTQLEHGIRFLDIRVQPSHPTDISKKDLYLVHGAFPVSLTGTKYLEPVLQSCYDFLSENPSETILISLKREGVGSATDEHLASLLEEHYITPNASKWHIDPRIPYLGAVRGKLVLVRRYTHAPIDKGYGLDATAWPNNSAHATHGPFCIQDFCDVLHPSTIAQKLQYSNEHLVRTAEQVALIPGINTDTTNPVPPGPLYLNFLSGANFWHAGCWPDKIAKIVNRGMEEWIVSGHHLEEPLTSPGEPGRTSVDVEGRAAAGGLSKAKKGDGGAGVVVMDCVGENGDWDLVELIVGLNMGVKMAAEGP